MKQLLNQAAEILHTRDILAINRTILGNTRTFLAIIRTAIALLAVGAGLLKFLAPSALKYIGHIFIVASIVVFIIGLLDFIFYRRRIRDITARSIAAIELEQQSSQ